MRSKISCLRRPLTLSPIAVLAIALGAPPTSAQLTDLQPGANFPTNLAAFGGNHSENIDVGDCDNDGDLDVIVANGGDSGAQPNRIFINRGGLQGGTLGTFLEETASRFAGVPNDTSRDIEFADIDDDGDLDIYVSNRGTQFTGEVSRFYVNQGGLQAGTVGFYSEDTDARWGTLVAVPPGDQVFGGNAGPWRDWSCDCDFGDLDDDGDLDLFHSSYGPTIDGSTDSRIFLNDGNGVFDEIYPWADVAADIKLHTLDIDLADFDGDYDLDVFASSRDSQARFYVNNCYVNRGSTLFTDLTQAALLDQGVTGGGSNYEAEFGDLDGDGDFDVWMKNFPGIADSVLRNNGGGGGATVRFSFFNGVIKGDPAVDENEVDLLDYDSDGDLDVFLANFSGTNWLYVSGVAQGLTPGQGLFHRSDTATGGSLANWPELVGSGGTSLDGECADMDNDGDPDILVANDAGQQNRYNENVLGVPDTHAPTFIRFTDQCDKPEGSSTIVHAQVRDNDNYYVIAYHDTDLVYKVNAGAEQRIDMFSQGGQQFRGVIPPQTGTVEYWIECTDGAGNTGVSATRSYVQSGPVYLDLGFALSGTAGLPSLTGTGTWEADTGFTIDLTSARSNAIAVAFAGFVNGSVSAFGGTLVPFPFIGPFVFVTDGAGELHLPGSASKRLPCGLEVYLQFGIDDPAAIGGVALSNAVRLTTPGAGVD